MSLEKYDAAKCGGEIDWTRQDRIVRVGWTGGPVATKRACAGPSDAAVTIWGERPASEVRDLLSDGV